MGVVTCCSRYQEADSQVDILRYIIHAPVLVTISVTGIFNNRNAAIGLMVHVPGLGLSLNALILGYTHGNHVLTHSTKLQVQYSE
jgi:NADH:ubiquinone oxidoreductase subunit K